MFSMGPPDVASRVASSYQHWIDVSFGGACLRTGRDVVRNVGGRNEVRERACTPSRGAKDATILAARRSTLRDVAVWQGAQPERTRHHDYASPLPDEFLGPRAHLAQPRRCAGARGRTGTIGPGRLAGGIAGRHRSG